MRAEVIISAWRALATLLEPEPKFQGPSNHLERKLSAYGWWVQEGRNWEVGTKFVERQIVGPARRDLDAIADDLIRHRVYFIAQDERAYQDEECAWNVRAIWAGPTKFSLSKEAFAKGAILADAAAVAAARVLGLIPEETTDAP
jgi:hypothetical protein